MNTTVCRPGIRKVLRVLVVLFVAAFFVHEILYNGDVMFAPESRPLGSVDVLTACSTSLPIQADHSQIPNTVHQIWQDENVSTYPLSPSRDEWRTSFGPLNYTVKLWTEEDIVQLIMTSYPWLLSTYERYPQNIQRADVSRLAVMHAEGGMYADLDAFPSSTEGIRCLQHLGYQAMFAPTGGNGGISNHFFMAEKGSEFLLWALHEAKRRGSPTSRRFPLPYLQVLWSTGPLMVTSVVRQYAWAYNYSDGKRVLGVIDDQFGRSLLHHAAGRSWHGSDGRALNYVADHAEAERRGLFVILSLTALGFAFVIVRRRRQMQR